MYSPINRINFTVSAIKIVEIWIDDEIFGGYRKPIKISWVVIFWGSLRDYKLTNFCNLLELIWTARLFTSDIKNGGKQKTKEYWEQIGNILCGVIWCRRASYFKLIAFTVYFTWTAFIIMILASMAEHFERNWRLELHLKEKY